MRQLAVVINHRVERLCEVGGVMRHKNRVAVCGVPLLELEIPRKAQRVGFNLPDDVAVPPLGRRRPASLADESLFEARERVSVVRVGIGVMVRPFGWIVRGELVRVGCVLDQVTHALAEVTPQRLWQVFDGAGVDHFVRAPSP